MSIILIVILSRKGNEFIIELFLILCLSLSCLMHTFSRYLLYIPREPDFNKNICITQAFIIIWFEMSTYIYATLITFYIHLKVIKNFIEENKKLISSVILTIGYVPSLIFATLGKRADYFGPNKIRCIIKNKEVDDAGCIIYYWTNAGIIIMLVVVNIIFTIQLKVRFKSNKLEDQTQKDNFYFKQLNSYTVITILSFLPTIVYRIALNYDMYTDVLSFMSVFFNSIQGFLYAFTTLLYSGLIKKVKELIDKYRIS